MINKANFDKMKPEFQKVLLDSMVEATKFERETAVSNDQQFIAKFEKAGNVIVDLTPDEKEQWRAKAKEGGVYDLVKSKMKRPEFLDKALSAK